MFHRKELSFFRKKRRIFHLADDVYIFYEVIFNKLLFLLDFRVFILKDTQIKMLLGPDATCKPPVAHFR